MNTSSIIEGILQTPNLWKGSKMMNIPQIVVDDKQFQKDSISIKLRLGMFVEQCIFQSLEHNSNYKVLAKNIQIIDNNVTLGELDCILKHNNSIVHLEIAYKFYLFDQSTNENELHCWIGPNRNDSLIEKINKLQERQFPLLHHPKTIETLINLNIPIGQIEQKVCFKAQLFIPYSEPEINHQIINNECVVGLYYTFSELTNLEHNKFYVPSKLEWTAIPTAHVNWLNFDEFLIEVESLLSKKKSPMFWTKNHKGKLSKCFAIWW